VPRLRLVTEYVKLAGVAEKLWNEAKKPDT
jgi:hypothetical protein